MAKARSKANGSARKNPRKRRRKTWLDEEKDTAISEVDRLAQRFNTKKKKKTLDEEFAEYEASCSSSLQNGTAHERTNKPYQIKFEQDVIPMMWVCCLCAKGFAHENLGDLFGPYYIHSPRKNPEFLLTKTKKKSREPKCELWFHGECLLWAPDVNLEKTRLTALEENIYKFWEQKCEGCHKPGASIPVNGGGHVHFPCAVNNPTYYKLNKADFSCELVVATAPGSPQL